MLIKCLHDETQRNAHVYARVFENASVTALLDGLHGYIDCKRYNTYFGDLVPVILSKALHIGLCIKEYKRGKIIDHYIQFENIRFTVFLFKCADHYDAVVPKKCPSPSNCSLDVYYCSPNVVYPSTVGQSAHNAVHQPVLEVPSESNSITSSVSQSNDSYMSANNAPSVKVCFWNVNGLSPYKMQDSVLGDFFKRFDLILLSETWTSNQDNYEMDGYIFKNFPRKRIHSNAKRHSGGLCVLYKRSMTYVFELMPISDDSSVIIRMKSCETFDCRDVYIIHSYIPPEHSTHLCEDAYDELERRLASLPKDSLALICGDLNARTNNLCDFDNKFSSDSDGDLKQLVPKDTYESSDDIRHLFEHGYLARSSLDKARPNTHGKRLIELCKASGMLIINGRCGTDKGVGGYTRVDTTGSSTVDYAICSPGLFLCVNDFHIHGKFPESDHLPVSLSLSCDKTAGISDDYTYSDDWQFHTKYIWGADELTKLKAVINDPISTKYCQNFLELIIEEANVNDVASALNKCVTQACDRICRKSSAGQIRKKGNRKTPWYDGECHFKRAAAVLAGQRASLEGDSAVTLNACREYRACKQNKERSYKMECTKKYNMHTCMTGRVCGQLLIN